jgi:hypothetical protein
LNEAGQIIQSVWNGLPQFYEGIELDVLSSCPITSMGLSFSAQA